MLLLTGPGLMKRQTDELEHIVSSRAEQLEVQMLFSEHLNVVTVELNFSSIMTLDKERLPGPLMQSLRLMPGITEESTVCSHSSSANHRLFVQPSLYGVRWNSAH